MPPLKICLVASEVAPFAKTGGLADVTAALPAELHRLGHDVRLFLPLHGTIDRAAHGLTPDEIVRDVTVEVGWTSYTFSLHRASLPGSDLAASPRWSRVSLV